MAVILGLLALLSEAATAVTTAYTESLRPGAELLWRITAVLLLYLMLPLLRLLLAGVRLLLLGGGRVMRGVNGVLGRQLKTAAEVDWHQQLRQAAVGPNVTWWLPQGRTDSGSSSAARGSREQQQLLLLAETRLDAIACKYPAAAAAGWDGLGSGCCQLGDFSALCSRMGGLDPERRLGPDSGYGSCAYVAAPASTAPAAPAPAGVESTVVQVQLLSDEQDVQRWCAGVEGCLQLQQAAAGGGGRAGVEQVLSVSGAAVGLVPAAVLTAAAAGTSHSQQQLQQGLVLIGLVAVPLLPQPVSLQAYLRSAGVSPSPAVGTATAATAPTAGAAVPTAAAAEAVRPADRLAALCRNIQLAPGAAAAVGQLCALLLRASQPAPVGAASTAGHVQGVVFAVDLLQGVSACRLAAALVVSNGNSSQRGQAASVHLNPAALLLHTQQQEREAKLLLSAVQQLPAFNLPAASVSATAAAGAAGGGGSVRGGGRCSVGECVRRLERCLRDSLTGPGQVQLTPAPAPVSAATATAAAAAQDRQYTDAGTVSTTTSSSSMDFAAASLAQAVSGVLLMLLTGDEGQGALLAPAGATTSSGFCCIQPDLALSLQQLQYYRLLELLRGCAAAELLADDSPRSAQQQLQGKLAQAAAASPQLRVRLGEASQGLLQQVLGCWEWGAAVKAACDTSGSEEAHSAPVSSPVGAAASVAPAAGAVAAAAAAGATAGSFWLGRWLAGRRAAASSAAVLSTSSQAATPQQPQQEQQGDTMDAAAFDWPQLLSALQQVSQSAGACVRMLQQQSSAPPAAYLCPISHELMSDPVVACDGHTYERRAITEWMQVCVFAYARTQSTDIDFEHVQQSPNP